MMEDDVFISLLTAKLQRLFLQSEITANEPTIHFTQQIGAVP